MEAATLQKSFVQSAPWAALSFAVLALAWRRPGSTATGAPDTVERRRQLQLLSLIAAAVIAVFAFSGVHRHEGLAYNQRYLLELLPFAAIALGLAVDGLALPAPMLVAGGVFGALGAVVVLFVPAARTAPFVQIALLKVPLIAAAALLAAWVRARARGGGQAVAVLVGLCIGWACVVHVGDDVVASRRRRSANLTQMQALSPLVPDSSALVCYWGNRDPVVPLLFDRDLVILDTQPDDGRAAPQLIRELLGRGRRVFVNKRGMPIAVLSAVAGGLQSVPVLPVDAMLIELTLPAKPLQ